MSTSVPLARDRVQTRTMHHRATRQITDVLGVCLNSTRTKEQWPCLRRDKQQELYAKRTIHGVHHGSSVYYLAVNEVSCGFDEAFDLLHVDSTVQFRLMMKLLHGRDFQDGTLVSMRTQEQFLETHHAAISFVYQDHRKAVLLREQHLTFFQTLTVFLPENHDEVESRNASSPSSFAGLRAHSSEEVHKRTIALSWLPFPRSHEAICETPHQVDLQYTLIVEEIASTRLRLSCVTSSFSDENDGPLAGSPRVARAIARRLALRSVGRFEAAVAAFRIGDGQFVAPHQWVKNEDRDSCVSCWKRFQSLYRRRHHCRLCGEVICGACSALRTVSIVSIKTKDVQKTRLCHVCHNKARYKANTRGLFDQCNQYKCQAPPVQMKKPLASESDAKAALRMRVLPASLNVLAGQGFVRPPLSVDVPMRQEFKATEDVLEIESGGYIGALPGCVASSANSKIISIKSMTRSAKTSWQAIHLTTSSKKGLWSYEGVHVTSVESSSNVFSWENGDGSSYKAAYASFDPPLSVSRSFLHPVATASKTRRMAQPIQLAAESSSCSSADRSFLSSYRHIDLKEHDEEYMGRFDDRRTSMMSSNVGLLDQDLITDESYFLPKLTSHREEERLKLMGVIISPACTLVDRTLMHRSCELAAAAFGVKAAFIARVDDEYIMIEHAVGTRDLSPQDEIIRRDSLCNFVLCQPPSQPWVVLDCLVDPRTREIPMVQHLQMRFFIGISVCVRGLPIACLCAYGQDSDDQSEEEHGDMRASFYDSSILQSAAQRMEDELESLVHGLEV